jgi:nucleoside-diphosphate-sugar epimerase
MGVKGKILITGAAGFVGSHLTDKFLDNGFEVTGVDNFITGKINNISQHDSNPSFNLLEADVSSKKDMDQLNEKFDAILHFACPASPQDYLKFPLETLKSDSYGTFNTMEMAREMDATYILASTSEVYGDPEVHPQMETYWGYVNPNGIRSVYDEAKRFSESVTMAYHRKYDMDVRIIRLFNTYGPRMKINDGRVVPNFIAQALKGEQLTVYGDGLQSRSFCYVDDMVEGIYRAALFSNLSGKIMNIGNPDEYKIIDFAQIILEKIKGSSKISFKPLPEDDPRQRKPDISLAQELLGWKPETSLDKGLEKTINFYKKLIYNDEY